MVGEPRSTRGHVEGFFGHDPIQRVTRPATCSGRVIRGEVPPPPVISGPAPAAGIAAHRRRRGSRPPSRGFRHAGPRRTFGAPDPGPCDARHRPGSRRAQALGRRRRRSRGGQKRTKLPESVCLSAGRVIGLDPFERALGQIERPVTLEDHVRGRLLSCALSTGSDPLDRLDRSWRTFAPRRDVRSRRCALARKLCAEVNR